MYQKPFTLIFQPGKNNELLVTLFQRPYPASRNGKLVPAIPRGELHGLALLVIWDTFLEVMRVEQARAPILPVPSKTRRSLSEGSGIRLSVLFQALNPLADPVNLDQLRLLHQEFSTLSLEETYYWFAQIHAKGKRGVYSLQLLLGWDSVISYNSPHLLEKGADHTMFRRKWPLLQLLPGPSDLELERQKASLEQELEQLRRYFTEYKTRAGKRLAEERVKGQQDACSIIMEMLDNLELSYRTLPLELEDTSWLKGFLLLNKEFAIKLRTLGIVRFGKPMQRFDPNRHQAVDIAYADHPDGTIVEVVQYGYLFRSGSDTQIVEKVLRPALVIVSSQAAEEKRRV